MKKLLAKIRNKRLKGNISLLVILILLASSVISLLSINQIQRLITYGNMTFSYFRAFYLAKAWTELGLTEVYNSGDGFNHRVESWSTIVSWNLLPGYEGFEPYFDMTITGSFSTLTNDIRNSECEWNEIKLVPWAGILLSLFSDETKSLYKIFDDEIYKNLVKLEKIGELSLDLDSNTNLTFAIFVYDKDKDDNEYMKDIIVENWKNLKQFFTNVQDLLKDNATKKYLTIKNPSNNDKDVEFCIYKNGNLIPYSDSIITVFWHYGDMEVGLQSIVKKQVPDWTLNVIGQPNP